MNAPACPLAPATPVSVAGFYSYQNQHGPAAANRLLFDWLSNATLRQRLYADMVHKACPLHFCSNASRKTPGADAQQLSDYDWADGPRDYDQAAVLLVHPAHIELALQRTAAQVAGQSGHSNALFSNSPYRGLGGFFMLALDDLPQHDAQRDYADRALASLSDAHYDALATLAFKGGALAPLKSAQFDLSAMAENIALRYVASVFGFAAKDLALLENCTRKIGRGLQYQNMGRHFVFEPATMAECRQAVVALGQRASEIIGLHTPGLQLTREQDLEKQELDDEAQRLGRTRFKPQVCPHPAAQAQPSEPEHNLHRLQGFVPILQWMASSHSPTCPDGFGHTDKGLIAAGLVGGAVTNIQNAICLVIAQWMKEDSAALQALKKAAVDLRSASPDACLHEGQTLHDRIKEALRVSPPAAFIPRRALQQVDLQQHCPGLAQQPSSQAPGAPAQPQVIAADTLVLIGVGGASWRSGNPTGATVEQVVADNAFQNACKGNALDPDPAHWGNRTDSYSNAACPFSKVFGGPPGPDAHTPVGPQPASGRRYTHSCPGMKLAMHMIDCAVRQTLLLPGLSEVLDPQTQRPYGLEMRWGQHASAYRMAYDKPKLLAQTPLQTVLPIKAPVDLHAQQLRQVLRLGAPFIEKVLRDANMVHFASFVFLDNDSKLVLFTMYDGDFDAYIEHFALEFGHLFDRFFACMAVQPPMPIREHPQEFVQYLRQFVQPPVEGYYFSAYPEATTDRIVQHFTPQAQYDLLSITERG